MEWITEFVKWVQHFLDKAQLPWEKLREKVRQDLQVAEQAAQPAYESLGRCELINLFGAWSLTRNQDIFSDTCNILQHFDMGVSENSVPLNPMVNDHYPY